jgi:hypothetical protein
MNHWPFIIAAYALTIVGTGGVTLWAFAAMRRAEALAEHLRAAPTPFVPSAVEGRRDMSRGVSTSLDTNGLG